MEVTSKRTTIQFPTSLYESLAEKTSAIIVRSSGRGLESQLEEANVSSSACSTSPAATWTTSDVSQTSKQWNLFGNGFSADLGGKALNIAVFGIERMIEWLGDPLCSPK